jgi:BASS family bile acid:Na+ symporter
MQHWLELALQASIILTVVGFGLSATLPEATYLFRHPARLARTALAMNVIMPAIAAVAATWFELPHTVAIALVALTVSPVPPMVQRNQVAAGGRMNYVVGLMVAMSVLAVVLVPLTVAILDRIFGTQGVVHPWTVAKIVGTTVLIPFALALALRHFFPAVQRASKLVITIATGLLVVTAGALIVGLWPTMRLYIGNGTLLMAAALAAVGLGVGHALGGPDPADRTVLAMSTASRHPAVALAIATSGVNPDKRAEIAVVLLYLVVATVLSVPYQKWRARSAPPSGNTRGER